MYESLSPAPPAGASGSATALSSSPLYSRTSAAISDAGGNATPWIPSAETTHRYERFGASQYERSTDLESAATRRSAAELARCGAAALLRAASTRPRLESAISRARSSCCWSRSASTYHPPHTKTDAQRHS